MDIEAIKAAVIGTTIEDVAYDLRSKMLLLKLSNGDVLMAKTRNFGTAEELTE